MARGYTPAVTLRLLLPPSVGEACAQARAALLDQALRADLAEDIAVEVASDYTDLSERAEVSRADLVWMPPTICARLEPALAAIYECQRSGHTSHRSAIVPRPDGPTSIDSLRGKRIVWVDRLSVGGYLLARAELRQTGLRCRSTRGANVS